MTAKDQLDDEQVSRRLAVLPDWRHEAGTLRISYTCKTAQEAIDLFGRIAAMAQEANHHPDVDWRYNTLHIALTSHDAGSVVTVRDVELAAAITTAAEQAGAKAKKD